jgi:hypothetical protein
METPSEMLERSRGVVCILMGRFDLSCMLYVSPPRPFALRVLLMLARFVMLQTCPVLVAGILGVGMERLVWRMCLLILHLTTHQ